MPDLCGKSINQFKNMKKLLYPFGVAAFCVCAGLSSCSSDAKLKAMIEASATACPSEIAKDFVMESIKDDGSYVVYRYVYADSLYDPLANMKRYGAEKVKQTSLRTLRDTPGSKEFFEEVGNAGRGFKYVYIGKSSGDSSALVIEPEEVQAIVREQVGR